MQVLLDTHTLLWFFSGNENISITARELIEDTNNLKYISFASVWEMAIKQSKGRLNLSLPIDDYIQQKIQLTDFQFLVVRASGPLIIKDGQDAHPTKLGNLFFGVPYHRIYPELFQYD